MPIAPWLLPVLWQEQDWRAALQRLAGQLANPGAAIDLARASEYIDPDRRRAIAIYERAGAEGLARARELTIEVGWWSARARLSLAARAADPDPRLAFDEAVAWWDAGHPDLCALALAGVRGLDDEAAEVRALIAGHELADHGTEAVARGVMAEEPGEAADAYVMAARFAQAAVRPDDVTRWLEAALAAQSDHVVATSLLLGIARTTRDPDRVQRWLALCHPGDSLDAKRSCALALIESPHHRGLGLRLLRQTLERAYETAATTIPGHLAMWTALAAHAAADGTRRDLLPFALTALQASHEVIDRVWLAALAAEISLRDAGNPVVAGAYAEIVAEHAPEHPIVRELVVTVASDPPTRAPAAPIPPAAIAAAAKLAHDFVPERLDHAYAEATRAAQQVPAPKPRPPRPPPAPRPPPKPRTIGPPAALSPRDAKRSVAPAKRADATGSSAVPTPLAFDPGSAPIPAPPPRPKPVSIAPISIARPTPVRGVTIIPPLVTNPAGIVPAIGKTTASIPRFSNLPPVARTAPVLAALRVPDRPKLPPKPADPPGAVRRARRISIPIDLCLVTAEGTRITGHSRDLSTSGLFVLTPGTLAVGDVVDVELLLPGKEAFTEDQFRAKARVARKSDDGYGIELVGADPSLLAALEAL